MGSFLTTPSAILKGEEYRINSQNNYTEMLLNAGVIGFSLYYLPIIWLFIKILKLDKTHPYFFMRNMVLTLLVLKLSLDFGMKSYNNVGHVLVLVLSWTVYFKYLKNGLRKHKVNAVSFATLPPKEKESDLIK